jgi:hypothetical protein
MIVAFTWLSFQAVRKPTDYPYRTNQTEFALTRPRLRARWATEPKFLLDFENVQLTTALFRQDHKNVAAGLSIRPIQSMSVGKPIRSGTTEKRLRTSVASRDGLAARGPKAKDGLISKLDEIQAAPISTDVSGHSDGPKSSARSTQGRRFKCRNRPSLHVANSPQKGPSSAGGRSIPFL